MSQFKIGHWALFVCPCCQQNTLDSCAVDTHEICPECGWEVELEGFLHPDRPMGSNDLSLNAHRSAYRAKAMDLALATHGVAYVRANGRLVPPGNVRALAEELS